jgi:hypothetical protein
MEEEAAFSSPYRLRLLYVLLLSHCEVQNPTALYELHWRKMAELWLKKYPEAEAKRICKEWIRRRVKLNYGNVDDPLYDDIPKDQQVPPEHDDPASRPTVMAAQGEFFLILRIFSIQLTTYRYF